jgi:hypothetical protein
VEIFSLFADPAAISVEIWVPIPKTHFHSS